MSNPFFGYYGYNERHKYPEYQYKQLDTRKSLLASVNGRIGSMNNILNSSVITDDEKQIVLEIKNKLKDLSNKIRENDKDKNKKPILRFDGTRPTFKSI